MKCNSLICLILLVLFAAPCHCWAFPEIFVTLLDGKASLLRGDSRYVLKEGLRLQPGDVIETTDASQTVMEMSDGTALAFGGGTQALFLPETGKHKILELFLLKGVVKIAAVNGGKAVRLSTQQLAVVAANATALTMVTLEETAAFSEVGIVTVEHGGDMYKIRAREYCTIRSPQKLAVLSSPPKNFIDALPRMFLDDLPKRIDKVKNRKIVMEKLNRFSYGEVEAWLKSTPQVRKVLAVQWKAKAYEPEFRSALVKNLKAHPEWEPVLFPQENKGKVSTDK